MTMYRAFFSGLNWFATISTTTINGPEECVLDVYARDERGQQQPDYHHLYRHRRGAIRALKLRYPGAEWREI